MVSRGSPFDRRAAMRIAVIVFVCMWMALVAVSWIMLLRFLIIMGVAAVLEWRDARRERSRAAPS